MMSDLFTYAKTSKLDEVNREMVSNIIRRLSFSFFNGEIAEAVLNQDDHANIDDDNDDDNVNTAGKVPLDKLVKMCDVFIERVKQ
jgi:hypothetical protein